MSEADTSAIKGVEAGDEAGRDERKPTFAMRYEVAKHLVSIGELKEASSQLRRLRRAARTSLEKAMVNEARACLYLARGELRRAEDLASKALTAEPSFAPAYRIRALIRKEREDLPGATEDFRSALALLPDDTESLQGLAEIFQIQERLPDALEVLDRLLEVDPLDAWAQDSWCAAMALQLGYSEFPLEYLRVVESDEITRGELAALLVVEREMILSETLGHRPEEHYGNPPPVSDCSTLWFAPFVGKAIGLGLLRPYPDGTFRPLDIVEKGPLAVELYYFLAKNCSVTPSALLHSEPLSSAGSENPVESAPLDASGYLDVDRSSYLWIPVSSLVRLGILNPESDILFGTRSSLDGTEARGIARSMAQAVISLGCDPAD